MSNEPTFQDLLAGFADDIFVGRAEQLALFTQLFTAARPPFLILAVSGQGGVGKTTLLEQFRHITANHNALTVLVNEDQPTILEVLANFTEQFRRAGHPLTVFEERYHKYRELKEQVEADPNAPKGLLDFIVRSATRISLRSLKRIPIAGDAVDVFLSPEAEEHIVEETSALAAYVAQKFTNKDERILVLEPEKELTGHFLQGLANVAANRRVFLFFDTYEQTAALLDDWLRDLLNGKFGRFSGHITFIIAGRYPLNQHWTAFSRATRQIELYPFTDEEARRYLTASGIIAEGQIQHLVELSDRLPVLLALLVSAPGALPTSVASTAVERFLQGLTAADQEAALVAALPRFFNRDLLALLLGQEQATTTFAWLARAHFVRERTDGWAFHDVVHGMLLRYYRLRSPTQAATFHTTLANHYLAASQSKVGTGIDQLNDPAWRKLYLEYLYHTLSAQPRQQFHTFLTAVLNDFASATASFKRNEILEQRFKQLSDLIIQLGKESDNELLTSWAKNFETFASVFDRPVQQTDLDLVTRICAYPSLSTSERTIAYIFLATLQVEFKNYAGAMTAANQALALEPESALALQIRGLACFHIKDYDGAIQDLLRATQFQPDRAETYFWRGRAHWAMRDYEVALVDFTKAITLQPDDSINYHWRGRTYRELKDYTAALADLAKAIDLQPDNYIGYQIRATLHQTMKNYTAAFADIAKAIDLQPDTDTNYYWRGRIYEAVKDYSSALADFTKAITLRPENGDNYYWRGYVYRSMKEYTAALADFTKTIELQPDYDYNYSGRGRIYHDMKDYAAALADFTQAITLQPNNSNNYQRRGKTYDTAKDYTAALADFAQAITLQPNNGIHYLWRGYAYHKVKDYAAAFIDLTKAIELQPDDDANYYWRGRINRGLKDYGSALIDLNAAITLQPNDGDNYLWRGITYLDIAEHSTALADLSRAIELQPERTSAYFWRAFAYFHVEQREAANADIDKIVALISSPLSPLPPRMIRAATFKLLKIIMSETQPHIPQWLISLLKQLPLTETVRRNLRETVDYLTFFPSNAATQTIRDHLQDYLEQQPGVRKMH